MKKACPKCGGRTFAVNAHVVQGWLVNEDGEYVATTEDCVEVTHEPDDDDLWCCESCGHEASGRDMHFSDTHTSLVLELSKMECIRLADDNFIDELTLERGDDVIENEKSVNFYKKSRLSSHGFQPWDKSRARKPPLLL